MKKRLILSFTFALVALAEPAAAPVIELNDVEKVKLENLRLKRSNLQLQIQQLQAQIQTMQKQLEEEGQDFATKTLKAHGNPKDIEWDSVNVDFKKKTEKADK